MTKTKYISELYRSPGHRPYGYDQGSIMDDARMSAGALSWFKTSLVAELGLELRCLVSHRACLAAASLGRQPSFWCGALLGGEALRHLRPFVVWWCSTISCTAIQVVRRKSPTRRTWPSRG